MEQDSESIKMANVQWTEVCVEGIVQQLIIDGEVYRNWFRCGDRSRTLLRS